jgi:hypothetical protein
VYHQIITLSQTCRHKIKPVLNVGVLVSTNFEKFVFHQPERLMQIEVTNPPLFSLSIKTYCNFLSNLLCLLKRTIDPRTNVEPTSTSSLCKTTEQEVAALVLFFPDSSCI